MLNFEKYNFHPVIILPNDYEVYDFSSGYDANRILKSAYGIGKYNEKRKNMYTANLFSSTRDIHMGIDIGAPIHTPIYSFFDGEIYLTGNNNQPGDYGYTIITKHVLEKVEIYALYGHLSEKSILNKISGQKIGQGEVIAWVGDKNENGGWNPHLHFQLCLARPEICDLPGVVSDADHEKALQLYPDPRIVLGPLY